MWRPPPVTSGNLKSIVQVAPAGAEIAIPPGEYEGPFVFDRPLRLVGTGSHPQACTLWTRYGPAVVVRHSGVSLVNVSVELTIAEAQQRDASIWHAAACQPDTSGAQIQGKIAQMGQSQQGSGWHLPAIIDLGDLDNVHPVTFPMVIDVPGPTRLRGELTHLTVQPATLPSGGQNPIYISIQSDKLQADTMLAGLLLFESGGETRSVWIIGRVLGKEISQWVYPKIILVGQSGRKYSFDSGMLLGKEQLRGEPGADRLAEKHAYIIQEGSGVWSLIQPLDVPISTHIDNRPVNVGQRRLLQNGSVISIGSLRLTVDSANTKLPLTVPNLVDFGDLSAARQTVLQIKNGNRLQKWQGTIRSTIPWIHIPQAQVDCGGSQTLQIPLELSPEVRSLPAGEIRYTGALVLEGKNEVWIITARLNVDVVGGLEVEPATLDFGSVADPMVIPPQWLRIRNTGKTDWQGTVQLTVPWLAVDKTSLLCPAGTEIQIQVSLTQAVTSLAEGANRVTDAIKVEGQGLRAIASTQLHFEKPKVRLTTQPKQLDWGQVSSWQKAATKTIKVQNTGTKAWQGSAVSLLPWLNVSPTVLQCPPQGQVDISVRLTEQFRQLPAGEQNAPQAIRFEGQDGQVVVPAKIHVTAPAIEPDTEWIDFELADRTNLPHYQLRLRNHGRKTWQGEIHCIRWLQVQPTRIAIPAGDEISVAVTLGPEANVFKKARLVEVPDALRVEGEGAPVLVGVRLNVLEPGLIGRPVTSLPETQVASPPQMVTPNPPTVASPPITTPEKEAKPDQVIDFGRITEWNSQRPQKEVRLMNTQPWQIRGTAQSHLPWLKVSPETFVCDPNKEIVFTLQITEAVTQLTGRYDESNALTIKSGSRTVTVGVLVELPTAGVVAPVKTTKQPQTTPATEWVVDFGTVADWSEPLLKREIRLTNSQAQVMKGTVQSTLPWVIVTPEQFVCHPGQEVILTVSLQSAAARLRPKLYNVTDAIIVESQDTKQMIRVQVNIAHVARKDFPHSIANPEPASTPQTPATSPDARTPSPEPATAGLVVDFGTVAVASSVLLSREIRLSNPHATQEMKGTVHSTLPWLTVDPQQFICPPGQKVVLKASLTDRISSLRPKTYDVADAIIIDSDQRYLIRARMDVVHSMPAKPAPITPPKPEARPQPTRQPFSQPAKTLIVHPTTVDFGVISDWNGELPQQEVQLTNNLTTPWQGTVYSTVPWLTVKPAQLECPVGETVNISLQLSNYGTRLRSRAYTAPDAVTIEGGEQKITIQASVTIG